MPPQQRAQAKAKARARGKAKAKAEPARPQKSLRQSARRGAVRALNALLTEVDLAVPRLPPRQTSGSQVEEAVRKLEPRCQSPELFARLRSAVKDWAEHGGELTRALLPHPAEGPVDGRPQQPSLVIQHKVLEPGFILHSRAFMATYNNRGWTRGVWPHFEGWVKSLKTQWGFHA